MDEKLLEQIKKNYPKSSIVAMEDFVTAKSFLTTGSIILDRMLGCGGLPMGKIVEIIGNEACGKTSLANCVIANAQVKFGHKALYMDAEWAYNKEYARDVYGIDEDKIIIVQPDNGEDAINIMADYVNSGEIQIVVLDSVPSIMPVEELAKGADEGAKVGVHAQFIGKMLKKMIPACGKNNVLFICINQWRNTIGYAPTEAGGKALEYWKSQSIDLKGGKLIEESGFNVPVGRTLEFKIKKNKFGSGYGQGNITLRWGNEPYGIDNITDVIDIAIKGKVIEDKRGWYGYDGLSMRKKDLREFFLNDPEAFDELMRKCFGDT